MLFDQFSVNHTTGYGPRPAVHRWLAIGTPLLASFDGTFLYGFTVRAIPIYGSTS